jgi:hypothetical protein
MLACQHIQLRDTHVDEIPAGVASVRSWLDSVFVHDVRSALAPESLLNPGASSLAPLEAHLPADEG